jgi:alpha-ribazole phosphatase
MAKPQFLLLRHGEIETGGSTRFVGQLDLPLTEKGVSQAEWWKERLSHLRFSAVFCSDLQRCRHTAGIVTAGRDCHIETSPELREINLGEWEGRSVKEIREHYPGEWQKRGAVMALYRIPGGESFTDLQQRVVPFFDRLAAASEGVVLIVAHAGVNRALLCHLLGMPLQNLFRIAQDYGCLNVIDWDRDAWRIRAFNIPPLSSVPIL